MRSRTVRGLLVLAGALVALTAAFIDPDALADAGFRASWFFSRTLLADLRVALAVSGACLAALPWLVDLLRREPTPAPEIRALTRPVDFACAAALIVAALALLVRSEPMSKDTKFYLGEGLDIAAHGGANALVGRCFDGSWSEDNRHPFYLAAIAPFAAESNRFLDAARCVSLAGAVVTLLLCMRACRRRGGEVAALAGATLLITNGTFVEHAVTVACESWWMVFAVAAFERATRPAARDEPWRWLGVGAWLGLVFLTKGTGALLLLVTCAWIAWQQRWSAWRALLACGVGFTAAALPLLVRNALRFGDPFWNVNRRVFWLDHWDQFFDPSAMAEAGGAHYFATHSFRELVARMGSGLVKQAVHLLQACSPLTPRASFGAPLLVLLLVCLVCASERRTRSYLLLLGALWIASFAWYAQAASDRRFVGVLLPLFVPLIAELTNRLRAPAALLVQRTSLALIALVSLVALASGALAFRPTRFQAAPWNEDVRAFLHRETRDDPDALYLLGPSDDLGFDWDLTLLATRVARPQNERGLARLLGDSLGPRVRYLIVEAGAERVGSAWVGTRADGALELRPPTPGWSLAASFPAEVPRVLVFRRL